MSRPSSSLHLSRSTSSLRRTRRSTGLCVCLFFFYCKLALTQRAGGLDHTLARSLHERAPREDNAHPVPEQGALSAPSFVVSGRTGTSPADARRGCTVRPQSRRGAFGFGIGTEWRRLGSNLTLREPHIPPPCRDTRPTTGPLCPEFATNHPRARRWTSCKPPLPPASGSSNTSRATASSPTTFRASRNVRNQPSLATTAG